MAPGHTRRFRLVDLIRTHHRRVGEGRGIGNEAFKKLAGIAHGNRIRHHGLRRFQVLFRGQPRPGVKQLAMHDRALQHHRTGADVVNSAIVIEGEHARRDQHELVTARRKVKMEIGGAGIGQVNRQICRNLVEQEGFVVGVKAFVGAIVERLRAIRRLVRSIPVAIDRHEIPGVQAEGIAVRAGKARPFGIDRGMHVHDTLQSEYFTQRARRPNFRQRRIVAFTASWCYAKFAPAALHRGEFGRRRQRCAEAVGRQAEIRVERFLRADRRLGDAGRATAPAWHAS